MSFEDLKVYQAAVELRTEVDRLRAALKREPQFERLFSHVDDAVDSIQNNIAEGSGSAHPRKTINFYDIARGSAKETRSGLRSLDKRGAFNGASVFRPIVLSLAIGKMLTAMIRRLEIG